MFSKTKILWIDGGGLPKQPRVPYEFGGSQKSGDLRQANSFDRSFAVVHVVVVVQFLVVVVVLVYFVNSKP